MAKLTITAEDLEGNIDRFATKFNQNVHALLKERELVLLRNEEMVFENMTDRIFDNISPTGQYLTGTGEKGLLEKFLRDIRESDKSRKNAADIKKFAVSEERSSRKSPSLREVIAAIVEKERTDNEGDKLLDPEEYLIKRLHTQLNLLEKNKTTKAISPDKMAIIKGKFTELFDKLEVLINHAKEGKEAKELPVDSISAEVAVGNIGSHVAAQYSRPERKCTISGKS